VVALARTIGRQEGSIIRKRVSAQEEPVAVAVKRQRVAAQIAQEKIEVIAHEHTVEDENEADTDRFTRNSVGELFQMFASGANNSSAKKGPGQMYEDLKRKHVFR
jgi:hypothetical protein